MGQEENIQSRVVQLQGGSNGYVSDESALLHMILEEIRTVRKSQEATEAMVRDFIAQMSKNPMLKMMASRFGG